MSTALQHLVNLARLRKSSASLQLLSPRRSNRPLRRSRLMRRRAALASAAIQLVRVLPALAAQTRVPAHRARREKKDPAVSDVKDRLANVKRKILVLSGKGGVGKSTVSAQLAFGFAARNMDVGLLDVDICGPSIPRMLGLLGQDVHQSSEGWSPVYVDDHLAVMSIGFMLPNQDDAIIWRGPRKNGLIKQFLTDVNWGALDVMLIDTPPGTSDEHLSIVTYLQDSAVDGAIIVTTPQEVSLMDVRKEINFCRKVNLPVIGVVENMSGYACPKCGHEESVFAPSTGGAREMCKQMQVPFLGSVPLDGRVAAAGDSGQALSRLEPEGPVAKCIDKVIGAILKETENKQSLRPVD